MSTFVVPLWVDLTATAFGALQGAVFAGRVANERRIDVIGIITVGIATGLGGGILRDLLLNQVPLALKSSGYLTTVVIAALIGMLFGRLVNRIDRLVVAVDAASLGLYLVVGLLKAQSVGLAAVPVVFVGVIAATSGSVIRDMLLGTDVSLIQIGSLYSVAAVAGAITYLTLTGIRASVPASVAAIAVTFGIRMLSLRFGWTSPRPRSLDLTWFGERQRRLKGEEHT